MIKVYCNSIICYLCNYCTQVVSVLVLQGKDCTDWWHSGLCEHICRKLRCCVFSLLSIPFLRSECKCFLVACSQSFDFLFKFRQHHSYTINEGKRVFGVRFFDEGLRSIFFNRIQSILKCNYVVFFYCHWVKFAKGTGPFHYKIKRPAGRKGAKVIFLNNSGFYRN